MKDFINDLLDVTPMEFFGLCFVLPTFLGLITFIIVRIFL